MLQLNSGFPLPSCGLAWASAQKEIVRSVYRWGFADHCTNNWCLKWVEREGRTKAEKFVVTHRQERQLKKDMFKSFYQEQYASRRRMLWCLCAQVFSWNMNMLKQLGGRMQAKSGKKKTLWLKLSRENFGSQWSPYLKPKTNIGAFFSRFKLDTGYILKDCVFFFRFFLGFYPVPFSPPVRWGLLDFMYAVLLLLLLLRLLLVLLLLFFLLFASSSSSSQTSSPSSSPDVARCQHGPPDCSGQRRTSIASSRLQWAAPDLNSGLQIAVGSAGPQPGSFGADWATPDLNRGALARLGNAGPQPGGSGADWATPDLTRGPPERSGQRRTSAAKRYVRRCVRNMSEKNVRKNVRRYVRRNVRKYVKRYLRRYVKRYVRKECQKKCQKICQ